VNVARGPGNEPMPEGRRQGERGTVAVLGGAGYVGAVLVPRLLAAGYRVRVLDLMIYGVEPLAAVAAAPGLEIVAGDVRDAALVRRVLAGCDAVVHLACISNDPSVELDPALSRSVNYESFAPVVAAARGAGVRRFVFASSGSVYGVSDAPEVTEDHPLVPVSLYNTFKAACEPVLLAEATANFVPVIVRPATLCGHSPRQRLDLTVNVLTAHAVAARRIEVHGGAQMRPNLHLQDMVDLYLLLLAAPDRTIAGRIYNAGRENLSVADTALLVRDTVGRLLPAGGPVEIATTAAVDPRSYRLSSARLERELGFVPSRSVGDGVHDLVAAFRAGLLPDPLVSDRYYNIRTMKARAIA